MTADLAMRPIIAEDRPVVERLWQLYRHDLSEFRGEHDPSGFRGTLPVEDGTFNARGLLPYFQENADRAAYLFHIGARPVGFALMCGLTSEPRLVAEFFVVRGARRQGVGRAAVQKLLALHPGAWEIPFQEHNVAAARFWRGVATRVGCDAVREERRPVPGKPQVPPDVWITINIE
jgi:predicted acetyltransferase